MSRKAWIPVGTVVLAFESELGQRLEAALVEAEQRVEVLELVDEDLRAIVDGIVAQLPDGVRPPAAPELGDAVVLVRPVVDREAIGAGPGWRPWTGFDAAPPDPAKAADRARAFAKASIAAREAWGLPPVAPAAELAPKVRKLRPPTFEQRVRSVLGAEHPVVRLDRHHLTVLGDAASARARLAHAGIPCAPKGAVLLDERRCS